MDMLKIDNEKHSKKINQKDILTFIKLARINDSVFINDKNVSKNLKIGREITIDNFENYSEVDFIEFLYFDRKIKIKCDVNLKFPIPKNCDLEKIKDYMFDCKKMMDIILPDNDSINARCIKINNENLILEVIGDDKDFLIENIQKEIKIKVNTKRTIGIPRIKKIENKKSLFSIELVEKNNEEIQDFLDKSRESENLNSFKKIFQEFEAESKNA